MSLIAQASSEQSICVAIPADQAEAAMQAVRKAFTFELAHGEIETVALRTPCSIIAAVGDAMACPSAPFKSHSDDSISKKTLGHFVRK